MVNLIGRELHIYKASQFNFQAGFLISIHVYCSKPFHKVHPLENKAGRTFSPLNHAASAQGGQQHGKKSNTYAYVQCRQGLV